MCGGDPEEQALRPVLDIVFPACAGVILTKIKAYISGPSVPRMCGGDPLTGSDFENCLQCSPHVRG